MDFIMIGSNSIAKNSKFSKHNAKSSENSLPLSRNRKKTKMFHSLISYDVNDHAYFKSKSIRLCMILSITKPDGFWPGLLTTKYDGL